MSPGARQDCFQFLLLLTPISLGSLAYQKKGERPGNQCVSIVNREIQLGLHCRRGSSPAEQAVREAVFPLNFFNMSFPDLCPDRSSGVSPAPTLGPQNFPPCPCPPTSSHRRRGGGGGRCPPLAEVIMAKLPLFWPLPATPFLEGEKYVYSLAVG